MVNVGSKEPQRRMARAEGSIELSDSTCELIRSDRIAKGSVLAVAQIAGIQAAKRPRRVDPALPSLGPRSRGPYARSDCRPAWPPGRRGRMYRADGRGNGSPNRREHRPAHRVRLCKAVDKQMRIGPIVLSEKIKNKATEPMKSRDGHHLWRPGGSWSGKWGPPHFRHIVLIITLSDRAFSGVYADPFRGRAGFVELLGSVLRFAGIEATIEERHLPDDATLLRREILGWPGAGRRTC